ncbi:MAG: hypothetical protein ACRCWF_06490 [Beijerinckiaceae bacterium]
MTTATLWYSLLGPERDFRISPIWCGKMRVTTGLSGLKLVPATG